jgi:hypothetical protein
MSSYIRAKLRRKVENRAKGCCEYCLIHQDDMFFSHEVDHIIAEKHRGKTEDLNLCVSCFDCNRYKGSDIGSIDIETDAYTRLYHPRLDKWEDHFEFRDAEIVPLTAVGRVTEFLLQLNSDERIQKRKMLIAINSYPCTFDATA